MAAFVGLLLLFTALFGGNATGDTSGQKSRQSEVLDTQESNGLFGVTSVAGITSRNGRISSHGGIQFYPGMDSSFRVTNDGNSYFYPQSNDAGNKYATYEAGNKYATGSIELYPGSVLVSSTARSGIDRHYKPMPLSIDANKPLPTKEFFFQPIPNYFENSRNFQPMQPWFLRNTLAFNSPRSDDFDAWIYPNFNQIFSVWR